jgi:1-acyl-sn-glycerol-3-phosphate acyltransferase
LISALTEARLQGLEHFPLRGPALIVVNHLGDADAAILLAGLPVAPEALGKIELYDFPILGRLMEWYGIIWLHRGKPDRRALRCAMEGLAEGRFIIMAPEGRYTLARGLEEGERGSAYLALKAKVPILPIALTGTENENIYGNLRSLKKPGSLSPWANLFI